MSGRASFILHMFNCLQAARSGSYASLVILKRPDRPSDKITGSKPVGLDYTKSIVHTYLFVSVHENKSSAIMCYPKKSFFVLLLSTCLGVNSFAGMLNHFRSLLSLFIKNYYYLIKLR